MIDLNTDKPVLEKFVSLRGIEYYVWKSSKTHKGWTTVTAVKTDGTMWHHYVSWVNVEGDVEDQLYERLAAHEEGLFF